VHKPGFFDLAVIQTLQNSMKQTFARQIKQVCGTKVDIDDTPAFEAGLFDLFQRDTARFIQTGKTVQHAVGLHQLALDNHLLTYLHGLGLEEPSICTRPVVFFNHPKLAKNPVYHTTPAHQDWRSMQGSLNALVVWLPLCDIPLERWPVQVRPGSHRRELLPTVEDDWYRKLSVEPDEGVFTSLPVEAGDLVCFSAFLVHRSGQHQSPRVRWSSHFRYNDLSESTFIQRGYPNPYDYKPLQTLVTPDFSTLETLNQYYDGMMETTA